MDIRNRIKSGVKKTAGAAYGISVRRIVDSTVRDMKRVDRAIFAGEGLRNNIKVVKRELRRGGR